ncbi:MAG: hypothetical protein JNG89_04320 [Planctomycetaceae bacterium]|nr:hypothetical protein [Planctomycetaceae bacterium]
MRKEVARSFGVRCPGAPARLRCAQRILHLSGAGLLLLLPALLGTASVVAQSSGPGANPPLSPAELAQLWEGQRTEIATAVVRFRCFNSTFASSRNSPERVATVLAEHDLANHPEHFEACLLALNGAPFSRPQPWEDMTLTVSGRHRRFEDQFTKFVSNGEAEAALTPSNGQVDLFPVGRSAIHHYDLSDIRWTPSARVSASTWEVLEVAGDELVFRVPPAAGGNGSEIDVSVDAASGIITHKLTRRVDGSPAIELFQQGLMVHASGIVFPQVRVDLQYEAGSARTARVILVESAEFNVPVNDAVFYLSIAKGTRIIDYRGSEKTATVAARPEADVLSLPTIHLTSPAQPPERAPASAPSQLRWPLLIGVHVIALLAGGMLVWRRRGSASPHRH